MEKHSFSDTPHIDARQRLHTAAAVQTSRTPIQGFSIVCLNFTSPERIMQAPIFPCSFYLSQLHPIQIYELSEILINIPPYKMMLMAQTRTLSDGGCVSERRISRSKMKGEREEKPVSAFLPSGKSIMAGPLQGVLERPLPFPSFVQSYSTLLPGLAGGQLVCGWRRTWELHPSEDRSELQRCFESIAMQKYHCKETWHSVWDVMFLFLQCNVSLHEQHLPIISVHLLRGELTWRSSPHQCVVHQRENHRLKHERH